MKNILLITCILTSLSGCIKTQDGALCNNAPSAPVIDSPDVFTVSSNFTVSVLHPGANLSYLWVGPYGQYYSGSTLNYLYSYYSTPYGRWKVVAQNGSPLCSSDTTSFTVMAPLPDCIGRDSFTMLPYYSYALNFQGAYNDGLAYYMRFTSFDGSQLNIYFQSRPSAYQQFSPVESESDLSLYSNSCYVEFYDAGGGTTFNSYSGSIVVKPSGSNLAVYFCNLVMEDNYYYDTYDANGYLVGN